MTSPAAPLPTTLRASVWLLFIEAAAVAVIAALLLFQDVASQAADLGQALALTAYAALMAAGLVLLGVNLIRRRRWARAPSIALQLIAVPIAYTLIMGGWAWLGVPVGLAAIAIVVLLITADTREALGIR